MKNKGDYLSSPTKSGKVQNYKTTVFSHSSAQWDTKILIKKYPSMHASKCGSRRYLKQKFNKSPQCWKSGSLSCQRVGKRTDSYCYSCVGSWRKESSGSLCSDWIKGKSLTKKSGFWSRRGQTTDWIQEEDDGQEPEKDCSGKVDLVGKLEIKIFFCVFINKYLYFKVYNELQVVP